MLDMDSQPTTTKLALDRLIRRNNQSILAPILMPILQKLVCGNTVDMSTKVRMATVVAVPIIAADQL